MTQEDLTKLAKSVLQDLKHQLRHGDNVTPLFRSVWADGRIKDWVMPEGTEILLNDGAAKNLIFGFFRRVTAEDPGIDAWVFATEIFQGRATEEGRKHTQAEFNQHTDRGFAKLQQMGWVVVEDALLVNAQTATDVVFCQQAFTRKPVFAWLSPVQVNAVPASQFGGRQKMWGASAEDEVGYEA